MLKENVCSAQASYIAGIMEMISLIIAFKSQFFETNVLLVSGLVGNSLPLVGQHIEIDIEDNEAACG